MVAFSDVRKEIANVLRSVDGIGVVHEFRRHSNTWEQIFARHTKKGRLHNWEITRSAKGQEIGAVQNAAGVDPFYHDNHTVLILGHMGVDDGDKTDQIFQAVIDRITDKFRKIPNSTLDQRILLPRTPQFPLIDYKMFGGTLVHFTQATFEAIERVGG